MKIKMTTDYMHYFETGDVLETPGDIDVEKALQLVYLNRAEYEEKPLKRELKEYCEMNDLSTSGTKDKLYQRVEKHAKS